MHKLLWHSDIRMNVSNVIAIVGWTGTHWRTWAKCEYSLLKRLVTWCLVTWCLVIQTITNCDSESESHDSVRGHVTTLHLNSCLCMFMCMYTPTHMHKHSHSPSPHPPQGYCWWQGREGRPWTKGKQGWKRSEGKNGGHSQMLTPSAIAFSMHCSLPPSRVPLVQMVRRAK